MVANKKKIVLISVLLIISLILLVLSISSFYDINLDQNTFFGGVDIASPSDWISEDQIKVYEDKVILELSGASWATFTDTNSMDPFLDQGSNAIEMKPESEDQIKVGDIISYHYEDIIVIHRVIEIDIDEEGLFYRVKGDNNSFKDPNKVRFDDVTGVLVAIVY